MRSPMTKSLAAGMLAAASLTAGAQTLLTQIPLGSFKGDFSNVDVAVNSATNRIYVPIQFLDNSTSSASGIGYNFFRVLVVNGATNEIVHRLSDFPADSYYEGIAIDPVHNLTYVLMGTAVQGGEAACTVSVVDGQTEETVKTIQLPTTPSGSNCGRIAVDPLTGKVYIRVAKYYTDTYDLDVIESAATGKTDAFPLPQSISYTNLLTINPYAHRIYFNFEELYSGEKLGFFDTLADQVSQSITLPSTVDGGFDSVSPVVNRETGNLFAATTDYTTYNDSVAVISSNGRLLATIALPVSDQCGQSSNLMMGLDVDPKTNLAFAFTSSGGFETTLYVIDGANDTILSSAAQPLAGELYGGSVAVNPDTQRVYVPYGSSTNDHVDGPFYLKVYSEQ